jgi:hypothetical protein
MAGTSGHIIVESKNFSCAFGRLSLYIKQRRFVKEQKLSPEILGEWMQPVGAIGKFRRFCLAMTRNDCIPVIKECHTFGRIGRSGKISIFEVVVPP